MSNLQALALAGSYAPSALSLATALASAAILVLGVGVLLRSRALAGTFFFLVTVSAAGWLAAFAAMYAAGDARVALLWARGGYAFAALLPAAVFQFVSELVGRRRAYALPAAMFWTGCGAVSAIALSTPAVVASVQRYPWGYYVAGRAAGGMLVAGFVAIFVISIDLLWRSYRNAVGNARERAGGLLLAFLLGSLAIFDYLPIVGVDLQPIGFIAALAFVIVAATAITRFQLADITPEYAAGQILQTMKGAVLVADMNGTLRVVNRGAAALLGYQPEELWGEHIRKIVQHEANLSTGQLLTSMGVLEHTMAWRAADGSTVDVLAASSFLRDGDGVPIGVVYVASDFTERKRAEEAVRESEHRYRTLFEMNPLPMWVYDFETLKFTAVNDAAIRHYGYSRDEFLSMVITDIRPAEDVPAVLAMMGTLEEKRGPRQHRHRRKNGVVFDVEVTSFEFLSGRRRSRLVIAQDITERKRAEEELRQSEERYRELFENANDLVYTHDLEERITSMNLAGERLSGYSREELLGTHVHALLAPEHVDRARDAMARKLRGGETATFYEVDMIAKDGRRIPLELSTRLIYVDGKPAGVQGIGRDITERKANEARYRLLFERNLAGVYRSAADGTVLDCNDSCARIFGYDSRAEFIDSDAEDRYFDEGERERVMQMLRTQGQLSNIEVRMRRRDGTPVWVLENVTLLDGDILEGTIIDITDRKLAHEQIEYQAYHDSLTGLPNRLLFRDRITVALAHARRSSSISAVMFLDLDQFKLVNDTLGHTVGDRLLQAIAARLVNCVRSEDTVARMGGDEFTILLAETADRRGPAAVAQKVLEAVRHPVRIDEHELHVTTSIGIALFPDDGENAESLLRNADRAMYKAKELGRDNYQYVAGQAAEGHVAPAAAPRLRPRF